MQKRKILIVDDEENLTAMLKLNLEQDGKFEVLTENNGAHAFMTAKWFNPDLVLLDLVMPGTPGGEVAYQLSRDNATRNIPIVFLTAAVRKEEVNHSRGMIGGRTFIAKPIGAQELISRLEDVLEAR